MYLKSGFALSCALNVCGTKKQATTNIFQFPGGGLGNQNPARTIAHSPPGVKETLNYMLRELKKNLQFENEVGIILEMFDVLDYLGGGLEKH